MTEDDLEVIEDRLRCTKGGPFCQWVRIVSGEDGAWQCRVCKGMFITTAKPGANTLPLVAEVRRLRAKLALAKEALGNFDPRGSIAEQFARETLRKIEEE